MGNFTHLVPNVGDTYIGTPEVHSYWILKGSWNTIMKTPTSYVQNVWKRLKNNSLNPWNSHQNFLHL